MKPGKKSNVIKNHRQGPVTKSLAEASALLIMHLKPEPFHAAPNIPMTKYQILKATKMMTKRNKKKKKNNLTEASHQ